MHWGEGGWRYIGRVTPAANLDAGTIILMKLYIKGEYISA